MPVGDWIDSIGSSVTNFLSGPADAVANAGGQFAESPLLPAAINAAATGNPVSPVDAGTDAATTAGTDAATTAGTDAVTAAQADAAAQEAGASLQGTASSGASASTYFGTAGSGGLLGNFKTAGQLISAASGIKSLLTRPPSMPKPTVAPIVPMPDPLAQQRAKQKALLQAVLGRGRAASILTDPNQASGNLGG